MKAVITPRYYDTKVGSFIAVEKKNYVFFEKFGYELHLIPYTGKDIGNYLDEMKPDLVVLAGGYAYYTKEIGKFEKTVVTESLMRKLPIFGICCGMWTINYYFGGTLCHNEEHQCMTESGIDMKKWLHAVNVTNLLKPGNFTENTFHSKSIENLGTGLQPFIVAHDGTVEGLYCEEKRILGVQFHMENKGVSRVLTKRIMKKVQNL